MTRASIIVIERAPPRRRDAIGPLIRGRRDEKDGEDCVPTISQPNSVALKSEFVISQRASESDKRGKKVLLVYVLMGVVVAVDQLTKWLVVENLEPRTAYPVLGDWFRLFLIRNPGAAFSFGENATVIFSCFQLAAVLLCLVLAWRTRSVWSALPVALIGAGAAGNLIDRIFRSPGGMHGHVVDFFSFWDFAIFNVADSAITIGVVLYLVYAFVIEPRRAGAASVAGVDTAEAGEVLR